MDGSQSTVRLPLGKYAKMSSGFVLFTYVISRGANLQLTKGGGHYNGHFVNSKLSNCKLTASGGNVCWNVNANGVGPCDSILARRS